MKYTTFQNNLFQNYIPPSPVKEIKYEGKAEADYWIVETAKLIREPKGKLFALTEGWPLSRIREFYYRCEKDENPALRWYTLRKQWLATRVTKEKHGNQSNVGHDVSGNTATPVTRET